MPCDRLEERLRTLEDDQFNAEDKEMLRFLVKTVKAARATIWLTNGLVKYGLPVAGVFWGLWHWGADAVAWAARGLGR